VAAFVALTACGGGNNTTTTNHVLVIDKSFDMKTADPQREFEVSGGIVAKALYSTLPHLQGLGFRDTCALVASSYTASSDAKTFTFKLRTDIKFSDGTPLTSADVGFSFNRLINIKGNPSFLLSGITVTTPDASTVVLTSSTANPAIPFIIPNPASHRQLQGPSRPTAAPTSRELTSPTPPRRSSTPPQKAAVLTRSSHSAPPPRST